MAILKESQQAYFESTIPPDIRDLGGTLVRFPIIPGSSLIALKGLAMNRGDVIFYYPVSGPGFCTSYKIETLFTTPNLPAQTTVDLRINNKTLVKGIISPGKVYTIYHDGKEAAAISRDGVMTATINNRAVPLDILIGKRYTLIADIATPWYSHRLVVKDYSDWQTPDGTSPHAAVHVVGTRHEYKINPIERMWRISHADKTVCSVHLLTR